MSDFVERLRAATRCIETGDPLDAGEFAGVTVEDALAAAARIDAMEAENKRLTKERDEARAEIADSRLENGYFIGWNSGWDEAFSRLKFPVMLRKMWSGGEVQSWLDERKREQTGPVEGSLSERRITAEAQRDEALATVARLRSEITRAVDALAADLVEARERLNADVPEGGPAHPVAAFLLGSFIHIGQARARAALEAGHE